MYTLEDWYKFTNKDFEAYGGRGLLKESSGLFTSSFSIFISSGISGLLSSVYREHTWLPWCFSFVPGGFWDDKDNQLKYMVYPLLCSLSNKEENIFPYKCYLTLIRLLM